MQTFFKRSTIFAGIATSLLSVGLAAAGPASLIPKYKLPPAVNPIKPTAILDGDGNILFSDTHPGKCEVTALSPLIVTTPEPEGDTFVPLNALEIFAGCGCWLGRYQDKLYVVTNNTNNQTVLSVQTGVRVPGLRPNAGWHFYTMTELGQSSQVDVSGGHLRDVLLVAGDVVEKVRIQVVNDLFSIIIPDPTQVHTLPAVPDLQ